MAPSRNLKLGLFVLAGIIAVIVAAVVLGIHALATKTVAYHSYFDESVQGLEIGAPVKFRGVRIGTVAAIDLAPDRKHVDVVLALTEHDAVRLDVAHAAPDLRAQLGGQGLTGLKLVDIDLAEPHEPPEVLAFEPAHLHIPTRPSLLAGLTDELSSLKHRLPELANRGTATLDRVDRLLDDIHDTRLVARAAAAVDRIGAAASDARRLVAHVERARLPERLTTTLESTDQAITQATSVLRQLGRTTVASADELTRTVRDIGDAAHSVRELADELERDPEALLKGRRRSSQP